MKFHEFGDCGNPHIMLIHGGGNSWWNYLRQARVLSEKYHVILPTLDGHGEEYLTEYISTEDTADKADGIYRKEVWRPSFCTGRSVFGRTDRNGAVVPEKGFGPKGGD